MPKAQSKRVLWTPEVWRKVAEEFAAIFVRGSQGGKKPGFGAVMTEAQNALPPKLRKSYILTSFANCPASFEVMVNSEIKKLTQPGTKAITSANGHQKENGELKASEMEIALSPKEKIAYAVPPSVTMSLGIRQALIKAGFKFEKIGGVGDMEVLINSGYHIEPGIVIPK